VSPNNDTLYSGTVLDLRVEPVVVDLPNVEAGRYYSLQFIDALTDKPAMLGSRTTGYGPGRYVLVPPGWTGELPADAAHVPMTSTLGLTTCRSQVNGPDDVEASADVARSITLSPLHQVMGTPAPPPPLATSWPGFYDAKSGDAATFLAILSWMLQWQQLGSELTAELEHIQQEFGIVPPTAFDPSRFHDAERSDVGELAVRTWYGGGDAVLYAIATPTGAERITVRGQPGYRFTGPGEVEVWWAETDDLVVRVRSSNLYDADALMALIDQLQPADSSDLTPATTRPD
jgi:hypothetical protein